MELISDTTRRILEIEARQDDALRELEALERRLEQYWPSICRCSPASKSSPGK